MKTSDASDATQSAAVSITFVELLEWEGIVTEVKEKSFSARLVERTRDEPSRPFEAAIFSTMPDLPGHVLVPGARFRWSVGYQPIGDQRVYTSVFMFHRLQLNDNKETSEVQRFVNFVNKFTRKT